MAGYVIPFAKLNDLLGDNVIGSDSNPIPIDRFEDIIQLVQPERLKADELKLLDEYKSFRLGEAHLASTSHLAPFIRRNPVFGLNYQRISYAGRLLAIEQHENALPNDYDLAAAQQSQAQLKAKALQHLKIAGVKGKVCKELGVSEALFSALEHADPIFWKQAERVIFEFKTKKFDLTQQRESRK